jgi:hypothetical protein
MSGHVFDDRAAGLVARMRQLVTVSWGCTNITPVGMRKLAAQTRNGFKCLVYQFWRAQMVNRHMFLQVPPTMCNKMV